MTKFKVRYLLPKLQLHSIYFIVTVSNIDLTINNNKLK